MSGNSLLISVSVFLYLISYIKPIIFLPLSLLFSYLSFFKNAKLGLFLSSNYLKLYFILGLIPLFLLFFSSSASRAIFTSSFLVPYALLGSLCLKPRHYFIDSHKHVLFKNLSPWRLVFINILLSLFISFNALLAEQNFYGLLILYFYFVFALYVSPSSYFTFLVYLPPLLITSSRSAIFIYCFLNIFYLTPLPSLVASLFRKFSFSKRSMLRNIFIIISLLSVFLGSLLIILFIFYPYFNYLPPDIKGYSGGSIFIINLFSVISNPFQLLTPIETLRLLLFDTSAINRFSYIFDIISSCDAIFYCTLPENIKVHSIVSSHLLNGGLFGLVFWFIFTVSTPLRFPGITYYPVSIAFLYALILHSSSGILIFTTLVFISLAVRFNASTS